MGKRETLEQLKANIAALEQGRGASTVPVRRVSPDAHAAVTAIGQASNGQSLDLQPQDRVDEAFAKIVRLVNASDKSEHAIRERLQRDGFGPDEIDAAVQRASSYGFINDSRYADVLIRSRLSQGRGISGIERELRQHRIDPSTIEGWPFEYTEDQPDEVQRALDYLNAHPSRSKKPREGAYRKLVSKGFSSYDASKAAQMWADSLEG